MFEKTGQINRGSLLGEHIFELSKNPEVKTIVEIGTWNGLGSTKCIYDGIIQGRKKDYLVLSLECNKARHEEAKINFPLLFDNFNLIYGTIVSVEELIIQNPHYKSNNWLLEDIRHLKIAPNVFSEIPQKIDLLILDGGEGAAIIEFNKLKDRSHFIILDDTDITKSNKNHLVREWVLSHADDFNIIEDNLKDRNGFLICEKIK